MDESIISYATRSNWKRLNVEEADIEHRLSKRANKRFSTKSIIPVEYFSNTSNLYILNLILDYLKEKSLSIREVIYNLALNYLSSVGLLVHHGSTFSTENKYLKEILKSFGHFQFDDFLLNIDYPKDEKDFLGIVYQSMLQEGAKNKKGSYYTPERIIAEFNNSVKLGDKFLDPCCGTGSFLLSIADKIKNPENIYGCDLDEIAVFIAKINLIVKFKDIEFNPNIYNLDFLQKNEIPQKYFDIIATNPPWGAMAKNDYSKDFPFIKSKESFSYFIANSFNYLKTGGKCFFVLPISILNVKAHSDIRKFILEKFSVEEIICYGQIFESVLSDVVSLKLKKEIREDFVHIKTRNTDTKIPIEVFKNNINNVFSLYGIQDYEILNKIYSKPYKTLQDSTWGLGIVTGNNEKFITEKSENLEKIYSGKNLSKYFVAESKKYIDYKREMFQQVAPDSVYRAEEKLVYKFVSKKLVFAYDNQQRLFLNSANVLIPKVQTHSIKTILALLNSKLFQYVYHIKFNELKVLKSNLLQLPFPLLERKSKIKLEEFVNDYMESKNVDILEKIDDYIFKIFDLSDDEIQYIVKKLT